MQIFGLTTRLDTPAGLSWIGAGSLTGFAPVRYWRFGSWGEERRLQADLAIENAAAGEIRVG